MCTKNNLLIIGIVVFLICTAFFVGLGVGLFDSGKANEASALSQGVVFIAATPAPAQSEQNPKQYEEYIFLR